MLFNSQEFLFGFLPVTLVVFFVLGARSRAWAIRWLILASLVFYGWWRPVNVVIIAPSIIINFGLASALLRLSVDERRRRTGGAVLVLGILFNVCFLGVFKYADFVAGALNDALATNFALMHIILPLGISFITFQKIAFLVDVHAGRVKSFTLQDYCTFVLFFPQLIAGPIVHYREMMPQFQAAPCRFDKENVTVGLTLLVFGLFKKVVLADNMARYVTPIYEHSAAAGGTSLPLAWMAAIGFTLQLYFDFSGYTDMALGLARFVGIRLPQNFNSPLQASSIIDYWLRWHMTLTRFLTAYIYNPLALALTRRRLAKGKAAFGGRQTTAGAFVSLLMFPAMLTMFISGLWHGAGYGFVVWGLLHGVYLTVNHAWRVAAARLWRDRARYDRVMRPVGWAVTFVAVTAAMVFFRSTTMASAIDLARGIAGLNGAAMPAGGGREVLSAVLWGSALLVIALACPNTMQILARYEPALGVRPRPSGRMLGGVLEWKASLPWAVMVSVVAGLAVVSMRGVSEFLYWQF
jgi:alginate O-acetyltransferase complex protein AlgI